MNDLYKDLPIGALAFSSEGDVWVKTEEGWTDDGSDVFPPPDVCIVRVEFETVLTPSVCPQSVVIPLADEERSKLLRGL